MTAKEAKRIFDELCAMYHHAPTEQECESWLRHLMPIPYDLAQKGLAACIAGHKRFMPRFADLKGYIDAAVDRYDTRPATPSDERLAKQAYDVWRQMHIERMPEDEYWDYVQASPKEKARIERQWREQYRAQRRGGAA